MKPEIVVFLVVNLVPLRGLVLPADVVAASSSWSADRFGAAADDGGRVRVPRPAGSEFEARQKRSLPAGGDARRLPTFEGDGKRLEEPKVADVDDSGALWNSQRPKLHYPHYADRREWGQDDLSWIRRSPKSSGSSVAVFRLPACSISTSGSSPPDFRLITFRLSARRSQHPDPPPIVAVVGGRTPVWSGSNAAEKTATTPRPSGAGR